MSIAVCAVIVPSRRLRALLAAFCASLFAAALAVGILLPERFAAGAIVAFAPLLAALAAGHGWLVLPAAATARRIDISGVGQLRLAVQQDMPDGGKPVVLLPGATVWPCCIVLRLRCESGAVRALVLLPDSVGGGQYRALAVALRALGNGTAGATPITSITTRKIL